MATWQVWHPYFCCPHLDALLGCLVDLCMGVSSHQIISLSLPPDLSSDLHTTQTSGCVGRGVFVLTLIFFFFFKFFPCSSLTAVFSFQLNRHGRGLTHLFWNVTVLFRRPHQAWGWRRHYCYRPRAPQSPAPWLSWHHHHSWTPFPRFVGNFFFF